MTIDNSTAHMLGVLGPSVSKSNAQASEIVMKDNHSGLQSNGEAVSQPKPALALAPTPSMVDILTHCLGQTKNKDNTPVT